MGHMKKPKMAFCPFQLLRDFVDNRPKYQNGNDPFFVFNNSTPVKPIQMRNVLKDMIRVSGFDESLYNCQSLRIGRASDLLKMGISVETIKKLGRWSSNAVFTYLRML